MGNDHDRDDNLKTETWRNDSSEDTDASEHTIPDTPQEAVSHTVLGEIERQTPKKRSYNKYFLYTLVGGLILSALISVVAVLTGEFNSTLVRALSTTASMVGHTLIALFLVSIGSRDNKSPGLFVNTLLLITVGSFITSLLGIWEIIGSRAAADTYLVLFYTFIASMWVQLLLKVGADKTDKPTRITVWVSVALTGLFYVLLLPTIFVHYPNVLPEFLYRVLAASVILLATSSVLTTVFHRIHIFKHPEAKKLNPNSGVDIALAAIVVFIGMPIIIALMSVANSYTETTKVTPAQGDWLAKDNKRSLHDSSENSPSDSILKNGQTQVTDEDVKNYVSSGTDCTTIAAYAGLFEPIEKGELQLIDLQGNSLSIAHSGYVTSYPRWQKTLPQALDTSCKPIPFTSLKTGDTVSIYSGDNSISAEDVRLIQKLN